MKSLLMKKLELDILLKITDLSVEHDCFDYKMEAYVTLMDKVIESSEFSVITYDVFNIEDDTISIEDCKFRYETDLIEKYVDSNLVEFKSNIIKCISEYNKSINLKNDLLPFQMFSDIICEMVNKKFYSEELDYFKYTYKGVDIEASKIKKEISLMSDLYNDKITIDFEGAKFFDSYICFEEEEELCERAEEEKEKLIDFCDKFVDKFNELVEEKYCTL